MSNPTLTRALNALLLATVALVLQSCAMSVGSGHPPEEADWFQFRGKSFGSQPQTGMRKLSQLSAGAFFLPEVVTEYVDPAEVLKIGDRQLEQVSYVYASNRLFKIEAEFREDRGCRNARGVVPALEAEYQLRMQQFTPITSIEPFVVQGKRADVRVTVHCWKQGGSWWSSIVFDSLALLSKVTDLDNAKKREAELRRTQRERDSLK